MFNQFSHLFLPQTVEGPFPSRLGTDKVNVLSCHTCNNTPLTAPPNTFLWTADGRRRRRTSNDGLSLELGSDRRETSATRVSEDLQISIFRR